MGGAHNIGPEANLIIVGFTRAPLLPLPDGIPVIRRESPQKNKVHCLSLLSVKLLMREITAAIIFLAL
jgi:hypothetical protein